MSSHFFGVIGVKHAPRFILFLASVTEAAALAAISRAGPKRWPVPLEHTKQHSKNRKYSRSKYHRLHFVNRRVALHERSSPRLQPVRRWSGCLLIGHEIRPWLSPSQTFLCPDFVEAMSLNHQPQLPPLHLMTNQKAWLVTYFNVHKIYIQAKKPVQVHFNDSLE